MKDSLKDLRQELNAREREIAYTQKELNSLRDDAKQLRKQIRTLESQSENICKEITLAENYVVGMLSRKKISSQKRYALFNQMLQLYGYCNPYRDRLKSGGISVKVGWMKPAHKAIARKLCDKVSNGGWHTDYYGDRVKNDERYIFNDIPGKSKYARRAA